MRRGFGLHSSLQIPILRASTLSTCLYLQLYPSDCRASLSEFLLRDWEYRKVKPVFEEDIFSWKYSKLDWGFRLNLQTHFFHQPLDNRVFKGHSQNFGSSVRNRGCIQGIRNTLGSYWMMCSFYTVWKLPCWNVPFWTLYLWREYKSVFIIDPGRTVLIPSLLKILAGLELGWSALFCLWWSGRTVYSQTVQKEVFISGT